MVFRCGGLGADTGVYVVDGFIIVVDVVNLL